MEQRGLERLGRVVAGAQDARAGRDAALARARARLLSSAQSARPRSRIRAALPWLLPVFGTLAGTAVAVLFLVGSGRPLGAVVESTGHAASVGQALDAREQPIALRFSEGTRVVLDRTGAARIARMERDGADVVLERGRARVAVEKSHTRRWRFAAGPFTVHVTGTRFALGWDPVEERMEVRMEEGSVRVSGGCLAEARTLTAGDVFQQSCRRPPAPAPAPSRTRVEPRVRPPAREAAPAWKPLFLAGRYDDALAAADRAGFARELRARGADELLMLGDTARLAGVPSQASRAYRELRRRFPRDPAAAQAAYALGRLHADQRGADDEAARWFEVYLAEAPRGPLAAEAAGRRLDAVRRAGRVDQARKLAADYLEKYPHGPYREVAKSLVAP